MSAAIFRHTVRVEVDAAINAGSGSRIISAAPGRDNREDIDVWWVAGGDPGAVRINVYGTGHPLPDNPGNFVGTCVMPSGLVWHVFAETVGGS